MDAGQHAIPEAVPWVIVLFWSLFRTPKHATTTDSFNCIVLYCSTSPEFLLVLFCSVVPKLKNLALEKVPG